MDVVEFLSQRIAEDEAAARNLLNDRSLSRSGEWYERRLLLECEAKKRLIGIVESARQAALTAMLRHADEDAPWTPEALEWTTLSLNALTLPYLDHPDFQRHWL
ncbi:MAG: hypothetical protein JWM13_1783 [Arthrobacter sp.]|nr:hypothetical protein [Arthrobacter sp.]